MADPLNAQDIIRRLCKLQAEVHEALGRGEPADCFCGEGGFWGVKNADGSRYDGTHHSGYRNDGDCLAFIEAAVRAALRTGGQQEAVWLEVTCGSATSFYDPSEREQAEETAQQYREVFPGTEVTVRPLVYGDTLGDSKGEG